MTTAKKKPAKTTAKKTAAAPKETATKKRTTKAAVATEIKETATEKVTVTIAPEAPEAAVEAKPVLTIGMFQKRLYERGYYGGHWDGHYGEMTKHAVARFQADNGLHPDGEPTPATLAKLGF